MVGSVISQASPAITSVGFAPLQGFWFSAVVNAAWASTLPSHALPMHPQADCIVGAPGYLPWSTQPFSLEIGMAPVGFGTLLTFSTL